MYFCPESTVSAMLFAEIPGLEEVKQTLIQSVRHGHMAHAQLFVGAEGSAALPMALAYATYINCTDRREDDACGQCSACQKMRKFVHPDVAFAFPVASNKQFSKEEEVVSQSFLPWWRDFLRERPYSPLPEWAKAFGAEDKQCTIRKGESRQIVKALSLKPFEAEFKMMIIWMPELLNPQSANALLKILEEPPAKTIFLLISHDANAVLPTILSRTQAVKVRQFDDQEVAGYLQQHCGQPEDRAAQLAYLADGSLYEAIRLQAETSDDAGPFFQEWMRTCFKVNFEGILGLSDQFDRELGKEAQKNLFRYAMGIFHESLVLRHGGEQLVRLRGPELEFVRKFAATLDDVRLESLSVQYSQAMWHLERNANARILFTDLSLRTAEVLRKG